MDILLTFAGNRDPYNHEIVKGTFTDGPVLTLLAERSFAAVHIFTTPNTLPNAQKLQQEITLRKKEVRTLIHNLDIPDPTDYEALFLRMSARCGEIMTEYQDRQAVFHIATASGTPQMQTVWFLLAQSGLVPKLFSKSRRHVFCDPDRRPSPKSVLHSQTFPGLRCHHRKRWIAPRRISARKNWRQSVRIWYGNSPVCR